VLFPLLPLGAGSGLQKLSDDLCHGLTDACKLLQLARLVNLAQRLRVARDGVRQLG
jgi:hypothetical protein